jgi:glycosyltransferase involved in cell wall biosynthesis
MPPNKRIAFVANTSWSIYKFRLYLLEKLIQQGFSVFVLAPRDRYTEKFEDIKGLTYIQLIKFRAKSISPFHNLQLKKELARHYSQIRPGLIFHYTVKANLYGSIAAARVRCPSISVFTGLGYTFSNSLLQSFVQTRLRPALKNNISNWFLNSDDQQLFIEKKLVKKEKTFLLPGEGVDTDAFYPVPYELLTGSPKKEVVFLLIARIIKHKGIYEFVQASEILQQKGLSIKCQLLGFFDEGSRIAISRQQVEEWQSRDLVQYLGDTDDVAPFIQQADCIVLPSYREGMPLSLLEGASMCKTLIAADTAGCRTIVRDEVNGYLCKPRDGADLAAKMEKYYHLAPEDKKKMGLAGRELVLQNFTRDIVTHIYLDKIKTLLTSRQEHR